MKGLEFDAVVVVDPRAILAQPLSGGAGALYTALTRSTRALAIVHAGGLPPGLGSSPLLTHLGAREPEAEWARLKRDRGLD